MAKEVILQVKMDSELKEQAELLYQQLGYCRIHQSYLTK